MSRLDLRHLLLATIACVAMPAQAQRAPDINGPKKAAQKAANATDQKTSAQTGQELRTGNKSQTGKSSGPGAPAEKLNGKNGVDLVPTDASNIPPVTREIFTFDPADRRDPFYSLILTEELRPLLSDLRLVGILYAGAGGNSVAVMRDVQTNAQYRVGNGMTLGRMRVAAIRPRAVVFTIDEFGLSRQDSLFMADTTKTRIR
jgi:hypothetical protein